MNEAEIVDRLDAAEKAVERGDGLAGTGFWKAVGEVKRSADLIDRLGPRIAEIDRRAFEEWALLVVPATLGTGLAVGAATAGVVAVIGASGVEEPWNWLVFGSGGVALFGSTHGLGHLVVGRAMGMRFTHWYVGSVFRPQPGLKVDYATYLRTPPRRRAWMHAAGALVTKALPFALIPAARLAALPGWVVWVLGLVGLGQIVTDAVWSVKTADWKKFRREMRYAESDPD